MRARELVTPAMEVLSLGAGVQSTALFILGCEGDLVPKLDAAVFADTRWEPRHVMTHLGNLRQYGEEHGVPVYLASKGSLIDDLLDPRVYATIPAWTVERPWHMVPVEYGPCGSCNPGLPLIYQDDELCADCEGSKLVPVRWEKRARPPKLGRIERHCTSKYKIEVINREVRVLLGGAVTAVGCRYCWGSGQRVPPWEPELGLGQCSICRGTGELRKVAQPPKGKVARQWVGFSTDEIERVTDAGFPGYEIPWFPLIDEISWSRDDCEKFLHERGWQAERSACKGCPLHGDDYWIDMADNSPEEFAEAVQADRQLRTGRGLNSERYLHESRKPLDIAVAEARRRRAAQGEQIRFFGQKPRRRARGCSPYGCQAEALITGGGGAA